MTGTLAHVALAEAALHLPQLPGDLLALVTRERLAFRLGAMLPDLSFYERLWKPGLALFLKREIDLGTFGEQLHRERPLDFLIQLVRTARSDFQRTVALGVATHGALDLVIHPYIATLVARQSPARCPITWHRVIEAELDRFILRERLGVTDAGRSDAWRNMARPALEGLARREDLTRWYAASVRAVHPAHPAGEQRIIRWLEGLVLFALYERLRPTPTSTSVFSTATVASELATKALTLAAGALTTTFDVLQGTRPADALRSSLPDRSWS